MTTGTTTVSAPARRRSRALGGSGVAAGLLGLLALGVVLGVLWWWLAPLARADVQQGQVYLTGHQELQVSQDGWFSVVTGVAGVLAAAVLVARRRGHDQAVLLLGPPAALVVSLLAWGTGTLLGPSALAVQVREGVTHPLTPLQLHAQGALLVGPLLFAVTRALSALFSRPDRSDRAGSSDPSDPADRVAAAGTTAGATADGDVAGGRTAPEVAGGAPGDPRSETRPDTGQAGADRQPPRG